ncbi:MULTISPECIES: hopanoid-associated sugar epimerase [unclassified Sphingomonas]|jgi:dihydroflavonol-4-reductase|uniref:hopanoid-associated sugar epimerase n=1 Tax=unclassified Sphingomonas TaxID=196159 RepID=UPI00082E5DA3|nr:MULTISPECIES: hopanoid-associated sugar epimerase [unclassified Sphingomonas]MCH4894085.1 NAD-dependent epimerase/dehydratase family protein [Sphingomonas sp. SFZ2018-12]
MTARKILVTGASGFVGSAVARALIARGDRVRLAVRTTSPRTNIAELDAEIVACDLNDATAVDAAMAGMEGVFHVAADYRIWAADPGEIVRNNLTTTRNVMAAARAHAVDRIVYTSSVATLKPSADGAPVDEEAAATADQAVGSYKRSKVEAERLVEAMVARDGLPAVIVNPSTPVGPRDVRPTPTGRIIVAAASGRMPAYVDSGLNLVHVDDVAAGHLAAFDHGRIGERYILGGQNVSLKALLATIAAAVGRKPPSVALPRAPLYPVAVASEIAARMTGREPMLTRDSLRMAGDRMYFRSTKAETELGYRARPYARGIEDAVAWFRGAGMIA